MDCARLKSKKAQVLDLAANVRQCIGLDDAALSYLAHLGGQPLPETPFVQMSL